jgi:hypothetical protein
MCEWPENMHACMHDTVLGGFQTTNALQYIMLTCIIIGNLFMNKVSRSRHEHCAG